MTQSNARHSDRKTSLLRAATEPIQIPLSRPDISRLEIEAVSEVLQCPDLALGPTLRAFEKEFSEYLQRRHAVAVNSGTSALFLGLSALGIGPGDEVITTPFTFIASVTSIIMTGATPVLADIDPASLNIDPARIAEPITPRTRALLPVEVFGNPVHMDTVRDIAERHSLWVVEDSCEALGSSLDGRPAGTFGDISTFAFYPNKQMTTGEGGMILTDDSALADHCRSLRNQGRSAVLEWLQHDRLGYNYRMSDINAALGRVQLSRLVEMKAMRSRVAHWYCERLASESRVILPMIPPQVDMSWFVYVIQLADRYTRIQRDRIIRQLAAAGIQCSNYFPPVHLQPFIAERYGYRPGDYPVTEKVADRTLALPFYNHLGEDQVDMICREFSSTLDGLG